MTDHRPDVRAALLRVVLTVIGLVILTQAAIGTPVASAQEPPRAGGVLKVAVIGEPPSLDPHATTATITRQIMWHVFETLFTWDAHYNAIPMLVDTYAISDSGRTYTFKLRRGVKFHNGKELVAADVVASLTRWGKIANAGKPVWRTVQSIEARDPSTVVVSLKEPSGSLVTSLAMTGTSIYPKEIIDAAGDAPLKDLIGTGPFRFVEHRPDRYVRLARFKDYAARAEPANGFGGKRTAYVDEILFIPVPDMAVRAAGVETGEYHFAERIKPDLYDRLKALPDLVTGPIKPAIWVAGVFNHKQGQMTDVRLRQAVQAALDLEPAMAAAIGNKAFYRLDPSLAVLEAPQWYSKVGAELYNQKNPEKARKLMREAGYSGRPVRWITTQEYDYMYKTALVSKQQLEAVGFKVDLQVLDWATLTQRRMKPELFDIFSTAYPFSAEPTLLSPIPCQGHGWWCPDEKEKALAVAMRESDQKKRKAAWDRVQAAFYQDVGAIKFGDFFPLAVMRKELRNHQPTVEMAFWNAWLAR
jgi:peptide/nickel transport system substrate-binding protein